MVNTALSILPVRPAVQSGHRARGAAGGLAATRYGGAVELVERTAVLAQLDGALAEARAGSGAIVLLGGDAGVGKTSVARAFVERGGPALRVLWGSCEPLATPEPLGPFHDMAPLRPLLSTGLQRVELLRSLLDTLRSTPTTVMVVDDAHWADDATLDALRFLGRRIRTTPGVLVVTFREDEARSGSAPRRRR